MFFSKASQSDNTAQGAARHRNREQHSSRQCSPSEPVVHKGTIQPAHLGRGETTELQLAPLSGDLSRPHTLLGLPRAPKMRIEAYTFIRSRRVTLPEGDGEQPKAAVTPTAEGEIPRSSPKSHAALCKVSKIASQIGRDSAFEEIKLEGALLGACP